jgi:hypothetical protein
MIFIIILRHFLMFYFLCLFQAIDFCTEVGLAMTIEDTWGGIFLFLFSDLKLHTFLYFIKVTCNVVIQ